MGRRKDSIMARTTKTPSYAPEIPERKTTRKTASSARKGSAAKKTDAVHIETEETTARAAGRTSAARKKQGRPAKKAESAPQKIPSEYVEPKPEFIALKQLQIPFYERYLLTVEETSAYFHIGSKKMYQMIMENPEAPWLLLNGNRKMIKREIFARWID